MDTFQTFLNACRNGQKSIAKLFLERGGIDLNRRDAEGNTALHYACREGYRDLAVLLLEKGADASSVNNRGETPPPERAIARSWPDSSMPEPIRMPPTGRAARR